MCTSIISNRRKTIVGWNLDKGAYDNIGEAYAYIMEYAEKNGYEVMGLARESYIDGIWNKESVEDWLTEIQLPIK